MTPLKQILLGAALVAIGPFYLIVYLVIPSARIWVIAAIGTLFVLGGAISIIHALRKKNAGSVNSQNLQRAEYVFGILFFLNFAAITAWAAFDVSVSERWGQPARIIAGFGTALLLLFAAKIARMAIKPNNEKVE